VTKKAAQSKKTGGDIKREDSSAKFEKLLQKASRGASYTLRLYVTGTTARSTQAISAVRKLCEEYLKGRYDLKVIDIYQQPTEAGDAQIIAAPTLVKEFPLPPKRLIGNLSDREKVIVGLNLKLDKLDNNVVWSTV
jgi:circadian clock protein KaiB